MKRTLPAARPLFGLALAVSCGGGDDLEKALKSVTDDQLAIMVLPQEFVGDEFADLEVDSDSGFQDNEAAADDTIDPDDTAENLAEAGRTNGYDLTFSDPSFSALEAGEGPLEVNSSVDLFATKEAAAQFIAKQVADYSSFEGQDVEPGFRLASVETYTVDSLGDEAVGFDLQIQFSDVSFYGIFVGFRLDRLVAAAGIATADDADVKAQSETLARLLEQRIRDVLLGDIDETPVPIPEEEEEAEASAPQDAPFPERMALSLDDLPEGVSIEREGYVADEDSVVSYEREFDLGAITIGGSQLLGLECDIVLRKDDFDASAFFTGVKFAFTDESSPDFIADRIREGAGFDVTNLQIEQFDVPALGEESLGVRVSYDTLLGRLENAFMYVRV
ncbi:MAG: hypothetical protein ACRD1T_19335, partial [Acidimicrobiia bacterium]